MVLEQEIVVVGAGPAGSLTAALLARLGHDVLLLDKNSFPRHKPCGDALPAGVIDILNEAGMEEKVETAFMRSEFYPVNRMHLMSPGGHHLVLPLQKGKTGSSPCVAPRFYFDDLIRQHAVEAGAEFIQLKAEGLLLEKGRVTGLKISGPHGSQEICSRIIVGADGVNSVIAGKLRSGASHADRHRALALRAYVDGIKIHAGEVEFYLHKTILPGYAWLFPTGESTANIGLGMRLDHYHKTPRRLKAMLEEFLATPPISERLGKVCKLRDIAAWPLNFGSQKKLRYAFDGALLVGDAAGFIDPLTGGGIHRSLISGQLAAQVIHTALQKKDLSFPGLKEYEKLCRQTLLGSLRRSYRLQKVLLRFPFLLDFFVNNAQNNERLARLAISKF